MSEPQGQYSDGPAKNAEPASFAPTKSELVRDAVVFQIKLFVDGIRDLVLIPISLGAAILSFLRPGDEAGREFYDVVAFGRETERKINLFSAAEKIEPPAAADDLPDLDSLVDDLETYARKEYASDRFASARERLEQVRASLKTGVKSTASPSDKPVDGDAN